MNEQSINILYLCRATARKTAFQGINCSCVDQELMRNRLRAVLLYGTGNTVEDIRKEVSKVQPV